MSLQDLRQPTQQEHEQILSIFVRIIPNSSPYYESSLIFMLRKNGQLYQYFVYFELQDKYSDMSFMCISNFYN